jgi:glutathione S-transferase
MNTNHLPALVVLLTVVLMFYNAAMVGKARGKYGIKAPATTGNADFERVFRVQMNTVENVVMFLPALLLFSMYVSPVWAGIVGALWLAARVWYVLTYTADAAKRGPAFGVSAFALVVLMIGDLVGIGMQLMHAAV